MFTDRSLSAPVEAVRQQHARGALVLDCEEDFETLPPAQAEDLGLVVDDLVPASAPDEWLPPDAPDVLARYASDELTVGMPGDGSVTWTRQTEPPVVLCKPRLEGVPDAFADFLVAEALVQVGNDEPEHFLHFFGDQYPAFAAATADHLSPVDTYQLAAACHDAHLGLATREAFRGWEGDETVAALFDAWVDAGHRLTDRLDGLPAAVARGETSFTDAAELACSAIKHGLDVPAPFDALDAAAYRDHGPAYAVEWADRTLAELG